MFCISGISILPNFLGAFKWYINYFIILRESYYSWVNFNSKKNFLIKKNCKNVKLKKSLLKIFRDIIFFCGIESYRYNIFLRILKKKFSTKSFQMSTSVASTNETDLNRSAWFKKTFSSIREVAQTSLKNQNTPLKHHRSFNNVSLEK